MKDKQLSGAATDLINAIDLSSKLDEAYDKAIGDAIKVVEKYAGQSGSASVVITHLINNYMIPELKALKK